MAIEIEKKYRLSKEEYTQIEGDLAEFKADFKGEGFEVNVLFGNQFLKEKKALLRIRKVGEKITLTFKQFVPNVLGVKQHIEHETGVESAEEIEEIIKHLGFEKRMVYEKRRKTWKFREVEVVLDELPFGLYMEIEGSVTAIAEAEMFLEADIFEVEECSYPNLTKELGIVKGDTIEARFGNKQGPKDE